MQKAISVLEQKKRQKEQELNAALEETAHSLTPLNLMKSVWHSVVAPTENNSYLPAITGVLGSVVIKKIIPARYRFIQRVITGAAGWAIARLFTRKTKEQAITR